MDILEIAERQEFTSVVVTHDFNQIDAFLQKSDFKGSNCCNKAVEDIHQAGQTIEQYFEKRWIKGRNKHEKDSIKQVLRNKRFVLFTIILPIGQYIFFYRFKKGFHQVFY